MIEADIVWMALAMLAVYLLYVGIYWRAITVRRAEAVSPAAITPSSAVWASFAGMGALSAVGALPTPPPPGVSQRLGMHEAGGLSAVGYVGSLGVSIARPVGRIVGYSG